MEIKIVISLLIVWVSLFWLGYFIAAMAYRVMEIVRRKRGKNNLKQ